MPQAIIYFAPNSKRSILIAQNMAEGAAKRGIDAAMRSSRSFKTVDAPLAIFYGLSEGLSSIFRAYNASKKARAIFVDLGYWQRRKASRWDGFHKIVDSARHPTAYFQNTPRPDDRLALHKIDIKPWRAEGRHILVAGMSGKAAAAEGMVPEAWEKQAINLLRQKTKRPIIYRPKPNWWGAKRLEGATFDKHSSLADAFTDCHAVVTHHSNVAIDALLAGIPCICPFGVASRLSAHGFSNIEQLPMPDGRAQWLADLAYCQYSIVEMRDGTAWDYIIDDLGALK